jgi:branched-chain amino acid transport system substrate-binding protein
VIEEKKMKFKYTIVLMLVFVLALSACAPAAEEPADQDSADDPCVNDEFGCAVVESGQTIKIGMSSPMTGPYADFGIDAENSGLIGVADAGEVEGFAFELIAEDDEGSPEGGAAVANKLVADPTFVAMAGPLFSGAAAAAMPIYETAGIPMMSPSATAGFLTEEGSKVFNRLPFVDPIQGAAAAEFMFNELGVRTIAVLHDGEDYGRGLATIVKEEFEALGGTVAAFEGITPGEADYTPILSTVATQSPEVVYFGGYNQDGAVITNNMKAVGLEDAIFFGCDGTWGADYLAQTGENSEGSIHANTRAPEESDTKAAFDEAYMEAYGIEPVVLSPFSYNSYDSVTILANAVKSVAFVGDDGNLYIPRGALVTEVRGTSGFVGVGSYTCNEIGECNVEGPAFEKVVDGEWVVIQ